jgi:hypothetical protein
MAMKNKRDVGGRPWAVGVILLAGGFVLLIAVCVGIAHRQDYQLVETDYYQKGLDYQQRIDNLNRARALTADLGINYSSADRALVITYPLTTPDDSISGTIILYRPSNAHWDQTYRTDPDSTRRQLIDMTARPPGLWRVKVDWSDGNERYYTERTFVSGG